MIVQLTMLFEFQYWYVYFYYTFIKYKKFLEVICMLIVEFVELEFSRSSWFWKDC